MDGKLILFSVLLVIVAVLTKILGCGLGAKLCGLKTTNVNRSVSAWSAVVRSL